MPQRPIPLFAIYSVFFRLGLSSFGGGISAWVHREIVDRRRWMSEEEFVSGFALAQILPGVNSTNLTIYVGLRLCGSLGATVALCGLLTGPFAAVIAAGILYRNLLAIPGAQAAMAGIAAVAVGMLLRLGIIFARRAFTKGVFTKGVSAKGAVSKCFKQRLVPAATMAATFIAVGVLQWPLPAVVLVLAPLSIAAMWRRHASDA